MRLTSSLIALFLALAPSAAQDPPKDETAQSLLKLTNDERAKQKRPALKPNDVLAKAAKQHAEALAKQNNPNQAADGKSILERVKNLGYRYSAAGENVAFGHQSAEEVVASWMNSNLHRDNLLSSKFTQVGIATAKSSDGTVYFVEILAAPARR